MTRISWKEVGKLNRLDEIIAYSIITLEEAYTSPQNDDLDNNISINDVSDWVRWEIAYDEQGRAYFRYGCSLYLVDRSPMANKDFMRMIYSPTKFLVTHKDDISVAVRTGDTSLRINTLTEIDRGTIDTLEKLLLWAIVLGDWWNRVLKYLANTQVPVIPTTTPIGNWGNVPTLGFLIEGEESQGSIDNQFDEYNGDTDNLALPDFLLDILDRRDVGTGSFNQRIDLPISDKGNYRENLVTCEEQDPALVNFSKQQLETLLPKQTK